MILILGALCIASTWAQWHELKRLVAPVQNCTAENEKAPCYIKANDRYGTCRWGNRCDFLPPGTICAQVVEIACYPNCESEKDAGNVCYSGNYRGKCAFGCPTKNTMCLRAEAFCDLTASADPMVPATCEAEADVGKPCATGEFKGTCGFGCPPGPNGEEHVCVRAQGFCDVRQALHDGRIAACKPLMPNAQCSAPSTDPNAPLRGQCLFGGACYPGYKGICVALAVLQCQAVATDAPYWEARAACAGKSSDAACSTSAIADGQCGYGSNCPPSASVCDKSAVIQCQPKKQATSPEDQAYADARAACNGKAENNACVTAAIPSAGYCAYGSACPPSAQACIALAVLQCKVNEEEANKAYEAARGACNGKRESDACSNAYIATGKCGYMSACPPFPKNVACPAIAVLGCQSTVAVNRDDVINDPDRNGGATLSAVGALLVLTIASLF